MPPENDIDSRFESTKMLVMEHLASNNQLLHVIHYQKIMN